MRVGTALANRLLGQDAEIGTLAHLCVATAADVESGRVVTSVNGAAVTQSVMVVRWLPFTLTSSGVVIPPPVGASGTL
ncbi:hypothetical protein ACWC2T_34760 [Streptomyces sp. NPDC001393]